MVRLPGRRGHRRGVVVDNHPLLALFHECEAITRWQRLGFAVLDIRERVVAGVDSGAAINADQLLAECDLETGQDLEGRDEVVTRRCSIRSQGRRESVPGLYQWHREEQLCQDRFVPKFGPISWSRRQRLPSARPRRPMQLRTGCQRVRTAEPKSIVGVSCFFLLVDKKTS